MKSKLQVFGRITTILPVLAGLSFLVGCEPVVSVYPLYSDDTAAFEPELLGCWAEESSEDCMLRFEEGASGSYEVTLKEDDGEESLFIGRGTKLGEAFYLDLQPVPASGAATVHAFHFASMHTFYRIGLEGGVLRVAYLDDEWLSGALDDGSVTLAHRRSDDPLEHDLVLTESTARLRRFVQGYEKDEEAFPSLDPLYRMDPPEAAAE